MSPLNFVQVRDVLSDLYSFLSMDPAAAYIGEKLVV